MRTHSRMHNRILNIWEEGLARMKFNVGESTSQYEWFSGQILNFDPISGKYGAFFPSDKQTVYIDPIEEAEDIHFL